MRHSVNKAVIGSGCGDAPKYAGEGVALGGPPSALGGPCLAFAALFLGNFVLTHFGRAASKAHHLLLDVTLSMAS